MISAKHCFGLFCEFRNFLIRVLLFGYRLLLVEFDFGLHDDELFIIIFCILLITFYILKLGLLRSVSQKKSNGYDLVLYVKYGH